MKCTADVVRLIVKAGRLGGAQELQSRSQPEELPQLAG
jgi:hypothetical protein